jgi:uncharacterized protein (DUF488 family)
VSGINSRLYWSKPAQAKRIRVVLKDAEKDVRLFAVSRVPISNSDSLSAASNETGLHAGNLTELGVRKPSVMVSIL